MYAMQRSIFAGVRRSLRATCGVVSSAPSAAEAAALPSMVRLSLTDTPAFGGLVQKRAQSTTAADGTTEVDMGLAGEYKTEIKDILGDYDERLKRRQALVGIVVSTKNTKSITVPEKLKVPPSGLHSSRFR